MMMMKVLSRLNRFTKGHKVQTNTNQHKVMEVVVVVVVVAVVV